jgi:hypothetical protein
MGGGITEGAGLILFGKEIHRAFEAVDLRLEIFDLLDSRIVFFLLSRDPMRCLVLDEGLDLTGAGGDLLPQGLECLVPCVVLQVMAKKKPP